MIDGITMTTVTQKKTFIFYHTFNEWTRKTNILIPPNFTAVLDQNGNRVCYANRGSTELGVNIKEFKGIKLNLFGATKNIKLYFVKNSLTTNDLMRVNNLKSDRRDTKVKYIVISGNVSVKASVIDPIETIKYCLDVAKFTPDSSYNILTSEDVIWAVVKSGLTMMANKGDYSFKAGVSLSGSLSRDNIMNIMWLDEMKKALAPCFPLGRSLGLTIQDVFLNLETFSTTYY